MGGYRKHPIHPENEDLDGKQGPCDVQLVRSSADWSHGLLPKEHSIQNAYIAIIEQAQHFIYIENQFFITATGDQQKPIENQIGAAIVAAVVRAHEENRKFRVMIVIPAIPGFVGDLRTKEALGTRAIIDNQYKSINRGEHSIYGQLKGKGIDPEKYIFVFNLRIYDRIHTTQQLLDREKDTGIEYREVQAANAMKALGPGIVQPGPSSGKSPMSPSEQEKLQSRKEIFEEGMGEVQAKDTVAADAMKSGVRLTDEVWDGGEELEKKDFFQEELYIHAKVMIVDDETLIVGSSNINDRSQLGDHDSELSAVVKHKPTVSSLRKQLWMEHLGLLPPQSVTPDREEINAQPPGVSGNFSEPDPIVEDALGEEVWNLWTSQATRNTKIYREMFHADPDDSSKRP